jgi:hypothetical protein
MSAVIEITGATGGTSSKLILQMSPDILKDSRYTTLNSLTPFGT